MWLYIDEGISDSEVTRQKDYDDAQGATTKSPSMNNNNIIQLSPSALITPISDGPNTTMNEHALLSQRVYGSIRQGTPYYNVMPIQPSLTASMDKNTTNATEAYNIHPSKINAGVTSSSLHNSASNSQIIYYPATTFVDNTYAASIQNGLYNNDSGFNTTNRYPSVVGSGMYSNNNVAMSAPSPAAIQYRPVINTSMNASAPSTAATTNAEREYTNNAYDATPLTYNSNIGSCGAVMSPFYTLNGGNPGCGTWHYYNASQALGISPSSHQPYSITNSVADPLPVVAPVSSNKKRTRDIYEGVSSVQNNITSSPFKGLTSSTAPPVIDTYSNDTRAGSTIVRADGSPYSYFLAPNSMRSNSQTAFQYLQRQHCPIEGCPYSTDRMHLYNSHVRYHTDILQGTPSKKYFLCPYPQCGYIASDSSNMKVHNRRHTGAKPFHCLIDGCEYRSGQRNNVKIHIKRNHKHVESRDMEKYILEVDNE